MQHKYLVTSATSALWSPTIVPSNQLCVLVTVRGRACTDEFEWLAASVGDAVLHPRADTHSVSYIHLWITGGGGGGEQARDFFVELGLGTELTLYQPMTHICVMSSHNNLYRGFYILGVNTLYRLSACFLWSVKG